MNTLQDYLHEHYRKRTVHSYNLIIAQFINQVKYPEQSKYKDILNYLEQQRTAGKKAGTLQTYLAAIKVYYDWLKKSGRRKDHPCKHMRLKDKVDHRVNVQDLFFLQVNYNYS